MVVRIATIWVAKGKSRDALSKIESIRDVKTHFTQWASRVVVRIAPRQKVLEGTAEPTAFVHRSYDGPAVVLDIFRRGQFAVVNASAKAPAGRSLEHDERVGAQCVASPDLLIVGGIDSNFRLRKPASQRKVISKFNVIQRRVETGGSESDTSSEVRLHYLSVTNWNDEDAQKYRKKLLSQHLLQATTGRRLGWIMRSY